MNAPIKQSIVIAGFFALAVALGLYAVGSRTGTINALMQMEPAAGAESAGTDTGIRGSFSLIDQDGRAVTEQDYADKYSLIFFGFTSCPDVCPAGLKKMTEAISLMGKDGDSVRPIFVTIDPRRDTPEKMKEYVSLFSSAMVGLTGTPEDIRAVQETYKVYAAKRDGDDPENYFMDHSAIMYLQNTKGEIVEFFGSSDTPQDMADTMKKILAAS